jgi:hypothetical protein
MDRSEAEMILYADIHNKSQSEALPLVRIGASLAGGMH